MLDRGIPRKDYDIVDAEGSKIGRVTSGTMSPMLKQGIGLGYIANEHAAIGSEVFISVRNKSLKAEVSKAPFVSPTVK